MKKRLLAIGLTMIMSASLFACAPKAEEPAATEAPAEEAAPTEAPAEEQAATEAPAEEPAADTEAASGDKLKIGYVCNFMSHEWYQNVTKGAQRRAEELGVELEVADANLDSAQQISFAENLIAKGVDILALTPVDATALKPTIELATSKGIKVVTESNPVGGEVTCVGADNFGAGKMAGKWMGEYAVANNIELNLLLVGYPNFEDCRNRVEGFKEGIGETSAKFTVVQEVDSQGGKEKALAVSTDALTAHPEINAIFGINDDSTQGAIQAYKSVGLDESKLTAVGFGLEGIVGRDALLNKTPIKAELAMFPDFVGACIVDAAIAASKGETVPERYQTPTTMVTPETYPTFYTQEGDNWVMNFAAIEALGK